MTRKSVISLMVCLLLCRLAVVTTACPPPQCPDCYYWDGDSCEWGCGEGETCCGGSCCSNVCCGGTCCKGDNYFCCGNLCGDRATQKCCAEYWPYYFYICGINEICCDDTCCDMSTEQCCDDIGGDFDGYCCEPNEVCCHGNCCPPDSHCCNGECCPKHKCCVDGECIRDYCRPSFDLAESGECKCYAFDCEGSITETFSWYCEEYFSPQ